MTKKYFFKAILVIMLVFGMAFIACDDGNGDNSGNGDKGNDNDIITAGQLTITGLSEHNGKYVWASKGDLVDSLVLTAYGSNLQKTQNGYTGKTSGLVANGSVTLKVYNTASAVTALSYTGNDTGVKFRIYSTPTATSTSNTLLSGGVTVNFSNGVGSGTYAP